MVAARPDWLTARLALGTALLRRGMFSEAEDEYTRAIGAETVAAIESGDETVPDLAPELLDALLGLAICLDEEGAVRRADRLYRAHADRMGLASPGAAPAFHRLAAMLERTGVPWGDPEAELARARALDPDVGSIETLPSLPDPALDPRTEPYTRMIGLVGADPAAVEREPAPSDSTATELDPPALISYVEPRLAPAAADSLPEYETLSVELLVGADGSVEDVRIEGCDLIDCAALVDITFAASQWFFAPAMDSGEPVPARIRFPVPHVGKSVEADDEEGA